MGALVMASLCKNAGKTSIIVGMARSMDCPIGYVKPLGDRLFYRKKQLWDYDSALMKGIFGIEDRPEDMSIGFEHSKLRYMYDRESIGKKVREMVSGENITFVEGGMDPMYGASLNLDSFSLAQYTGGKLVMVASGNEDAIMDEVYFLKNHVSVKDVDIAGIILNNVKDMGDFKDAHSAELESMGMNVLGVMPHLDELAEVTVEFLAHTLFAKVIAGEDGMKKLVRNVFVGAMSADSALHNPAFSKSDKLIITSGDRSDMILAALESDTSCIVLTNNIIPPAKITSMAHERNIPLLVVPSDTYQTAKRIHGTDPLLSPGDTDKIRLLEETVKKNIDLKVLEDL